VLNRGSVLGLIFYRKKFVYIRLQCSQPRRALAVACGHAFCSESSESDAQIFMAVAALPLNAGGTCAASERVPASQ